MKCWCYFGNGQWVPSPLCLPSPTPRWPAEGLSLPPGLLGCSRNAQRGPQTPTWSCKCYLLVCFSREEAFIHLSNSAKLKSSSQPAMSDLSTHETLSPERCHPRTCSPVPPSAGPPSEAQAKRHSSGDSVWRLCDNLEPSAFYLC